MLDGKEIIAIAVPLEQAKIGIYFLIAGPEIVYIGQSIDADSRVRQHRRGHMVFDRWAWLGCPALELDRLERAYLDAFLPRYNQDSETRTKRGDGLAGPALPAIDPSDFKDPAWQAALAEIEWDNGVEVAERMSRLRAMRHPPHP